MDPKYLKFVAKTASITNTSQDFLSSLKMCPRSTAPKCFRNAWTKCLKWKK